MASFQDRMEHLNLEGDEGKKATRWLLEHLAQHEEDACFVAARSLMDHAESAEGCDKRVLQGEMFGYLVRALEDFGAACLMWLQEGKNPVEAYLAARTLEIRAFFAECRKGLPGEKLARIYGVARGETLCELNWLSRTKAENDAPMLDWISGQRLQILSGLGAVYQQTGPEPNETLGPWQVAAAKSRSFHLVRSGEGESQCHNLLLGVGDNPDPKQPGKPVPALFFIKTELPADFSERVFTQIDEVLERRCELANLHMDLSYDPRAGLVQAQQAWDKLKNQQNEEKAAKEKVDLDKARQDLAKPKPDGEKPKPDAERPKGIEKAKVHEGSELMPPAAATPKEEEKKSEESGSQVIGGLKIKRGMDELWN